MSFIDDTIAKAARAAGGANNWIQRKANALRAGAESVQPAAEPVAPEVPMSSPQPDPPGGSEPCGAAGTGRREGAGRDG
jgi:hypothetical protein